MDTVNCTCVCHLRGDGCKEVVPLRAALAELVRLKDGPRDDAYRAAKEQAWQSAREALR